MGDQDDGKDDENGQEKINEDNEDNHMDKPLGLKFHEAAEEGADDADGQEESVDGDDGGDERGDNLPDDMNIGENEEELLSDADGLKEDDELTNLQGEEEQREENEDTIPDEEDNNEDGNAKLSGGEGNQPEMDENSEQKDESQPEPMEIADQADESNSHIKPPVHGVHSSNGKDAILNSLENDEKSKEELSAQVDPSFGNGSSTRNDGQGASGELMSNAGNDQSNPSTEDIQHKNNRLDAPNPFMNKGDIQKKWFRRLNMIDNDDLENINEGEDDTSEEDAGFNRDGDNDPKSQYEFSQNKNDKNCEQVLANVDAEDAMQLPETGELEPQKNYEQDQEEDKLNSDEKSSKRSRQNEQEDTEENTVPQIKKKRSDKQNDIKENTDASLENDDDIDDLMSLEISIDCERESIEVGDLPVHEQILNGASIQTNRNFKFSDSSNIDAEPGEVNSFKSSVETKIGHNVGAARIKWQQHRMGTEAHAIRLAEQLRLILEPTLATRLQGDYRTGKRINMRKVIPYIASGFRKDKIWLRRTKPAKRDYQVMLLIDDSKSMGLAGTLALSSLALLSTAMTRLEIGELCVASFAEEVNILHKFGIPFSEESGAEVVSQFRFNANYTKLGESLQSIIPIFSDARDSLSSSNDSAILQLCFVISDARIDTDNRTKLEGIIRKMSEQHILVVLVIIDCNENSRDSIFNTKTVSFVGDKVVTKSYFDSFPFPYYVAIQNLQTLPEVLADALKQWFELIRIQMNG